jgi:hypothetical protein
MAGPSTAVFQKLFSQRRLASSLAAEAAVVANEEILPQYLSLPVKPRNSKAKDISRQNPRVSMCGRFLPLFLQ